MYTINPNLFGSCFVVPTVITDQHIKLAGAIQIKILLLLCRNISNEIDIDSIASQLGIQAELAADALQYWIDAGVVKMTTDEASEPVSAQSGFDAMGERASSGTIDTSFEEKKRLSPLPIIKPTQSTIASRCSESLELTHFFNEVQRIFGSTLGYNTQASLLMMIDDFGLDCNILLMICEYARTVDKLNMHFITSTAKTWAEAEVKTVEQASEMLSRQRRVDENWHHFASRVGISNPKPTASQKKYLDEWINTMGFTINMIEQAYEEMANNCARLSFSYMNSILKRWNSEGIKSEQAIASQSKKSKPKQAEGLDASYDIDLAESNADNDDLIFKKRRKG